MTKDEFASLEKILQTIAGATIQQAQLIQYDMSNSKYGFMESMAATKGIDYSEQVTVPDAVLSMRDIWIKYATTGQIGGISGQAFPLVSADDDEDSVDDSNIEEDLDILRISNNLKSKTAERLAAAEQARSRSTEHDNTPKPEVQSEGAERSAASEE